MNGFYLDIAEKHKEGFGTETDRVDCRLRSPDAHLKTPVPFLKNGAGREMGENRQCRE